MKVKGIKVEYYMKNGAVLVDDSTRFDSPVEDTDSNYVKLHECFTDIAKRALKVESGGYAVMGTMYVRSSEVQAIKLTPVKEE